MYGLMHVLLRKLILYIVHAEGEQMDFLLHRILKWSRTHHKARIRICLARSEWAIITWQIVPSHHKSYAAVCMCM